MNDLTSAKIFCDDCGEEIDVTTAMHQRRLKIKGRYIDEQYSECPYCKHQTTIIMTDKAVNKKQIQFKQTLEKAQKLRNEIHGMCEELAKFVKKNRKEGGEDAD